MCLLLLQNCFQKPSTKEMVQALSRWGVGPREHTLPIVDELPDNLALSARNVERLEVNAANALRVYDVLRADKILIETSALRYIQVGFELENPHGHWRHCVFADSTTRQ